jgi:hypothetical protein
MFSSFFVFVCIAPPPHPPRKEKKILERERDYMCSIDCFFDWVPDPCLLMQITFCICFEFLFFLFCMMMVTMPGILFFIGVGWFFVSLSKQSLPTPRSFFPTPI